MPGGMEEREAVEVQCDAPSGGHRIAHFTARLILLNWRIDIDLGDTIVKNIPVDVLSNEPPKHSSARRPPG